MVTKATNRLTGIVALSHSQLRLHEETHIICLEQRLEIDRASEDGQRDVLILDETSDNASKLPSFVPSASHLYSLGVPPS